MVIDDDKPDKKILIDAFKYIKDNKKSQKRYHGSDNGFSFGY